VTISSEIKALDRLTGKLTGSSCKWLSVKYSGAVHPPRTEGDTLVTGDRKVLDDAQLGHVRVMAA
jgi:hypothetical protein